MKEHMRYKADTTPPRSRTHWHKLMFSYLDFLNLVRPLSSNRAVADDARSQRGIWCHRTSASACFFGNDRSSRSRVRTRLITKCVYYEWASDSFAYLCPCNNSWYARAYPRVKNISISSFLNLNNEKYTKGNVTKIIHNEINISRPVATTIWLLFVLLIKG